VSVIIEGCGDDRELDPDARPSPEINPQITVALIQRLLTEGSLNEEMRAPALGTRDLVCRPIGTG